MPGPMVLSPDFREFVALLNAHEVRYLVVGGYAVAFHGHPRYTKDLDVWIDRDPANAARLLLALADFGFGSVGLTTEDFLKPDQVVQLGRPPNRIDLITRLEGVDFASCYPYRETPEVGGIQIAFIDLDHLKQNKRAVGRYQDLADLENLE
ncbi:MAG: hypothetical protein ACR2GR_01025 [Rhodothermales bacterium]